MKNPNHLKSTTTVDFLHYEKSLWQKYNSIAGLDEAGRGAWAGPVVAAAVIVSPHCHIDGIDDSKKLTPKKRDELYNKIIENCVSYAVGIVNSDVIDEINILQATKRAMLQAVAGLEIQADYLLIDGKNMELATSIPQKSIIDGDALSFSIAAASILAKVTRDRMMMELIKKYPEYSFEKHKGYGTKAHQEALKQFGCTPIHRKSYAPIARLLS